MWLSKFQIFKISNPQVFTFLNFKNQKVRYTILLNTAKCQMVRCEELRFPKMFPHFSCICWSNGVVNRGFKGPLRVQKMSKF